MVLPGWTENGGWASGHPSTPARPHDTRLSPSPGGERANAHAGRGAAPVPERRRGRLPQCKDSCPRPRRGLGRTRSHSPTLLPAPGVCGGLYGVGPEQSRAKSRCKTTLLLSLGLVTRVWDHDNWGWGSYCTPRLLWGEKSGDQKGKEDLVAFGRGRERRANLGELLLALGKGDRKESSERRADQLPAAPRLLGYPLAFPLTFIRGRQGGRAATVFTRRSKS